MVMKAGYPGATTGSLEKLDSRTFVCQDSGSMSGAREKKPSATLNYLFPLLFFFFFGCTCYVCLFELFVHHWQ